MFLHSWTRDCCSSWRLHGDTRCFLIGRFGSSHKISMTLRFGDFEGHGSWWVCCYCRSAYLWYSFENWRHYVILWLLLMMWHLICYVLNVLVTRFKRKICQILYGIYHVLNNSIPNFNASSHTFSNYLTYSKYCVGCGLECMYSLLLLYVVIYKYLHFHCESLNEPLHLRCNLYLHEQIDLSHTHICAIWAG